MRYISRKLAEVATDAARHFPALVLTGPRRSGKTTLLRNLFPASQYVLLEDPDVQARVRSDPRAFLEGLRPPVVFDEIQNAPDLLDYVRTLIDSHPRRMGQWLFTGSQEAPLMRGISESMAGRAAVLQLLPFSLAETAKVTILHGGFPEVLARPKGRDLWFASYPGGNRPDHSGATVFRKLRKEADQVAENVHRRFRAGMLPAGGGFVSG